MTEDEIVLIIASKMSPHLQVIAVIRQVTRYTGAGIYNKNFRPAKYYKVTLDSFVLAVRNSKSLQLIFALCPKASYLGKEYANELKIIYCELY